MQISLQESMNEKKVSVKLRNENASVKMLPKKTLLRN
jgi:hypothetical protein